MSASTGHKKSGYGEIQTKEIHTAFHLFLHEFTVFAAPFSCKGASALTARLKSTSFNEFPPVRSRRLAINTFSSSTDQTAFFGGRIED
jgi:hypothetical protein